MSLLIDDVLVNGWHFEDQIDERWQLDKLADKLHILRLNYIPQLNSKTLGNLGCIRSPFDHMWIETPLGGGFLFSFSDERFKDYLIKHPPPPGLVYDAERGSMIVLGCIRKVNRQNVQYRRKMMYFLDAEGRIVDRNSLQGDLLDSFNRVNGAVLYALALFHCKNVMVATVEPPCKLSAKHRRRYGRSLVTYKEIIIPDGTPRQSSTGIERQPANTENQPWQIIRGHFKEYPPEAPLFGQHVGKWWWAAHVRGDRANGEIHRSYATEDES